MSRYASDTAEKLWAAKRQAPVITDYIPPTGPEESSRFNAAGPEYGMPMPPMRESRMARDGRLWDGEFGYDYGNDLPEFYSANGFYKQPSMWERLGGDKLNLLFASGMDLMNGFGGNDEAQRRQDEMYQEMLRGQQAALKNGTRW